MKQTKNTKNKHSDTLNYKLLSIISFFIIGIISTMYGLQMSCNAITANASEIDIEFPLDNEGSTAIYTGKSNSVTYDDNKIELKNYPAIQYGDTWMIPINEFLVENMYCTYKLDINKKTIIVEDEYRNHTIKFTLESNIMVCDNKKVTMDMSVIEGTNTSTGKSEYYVPASATIKSLGYAYSDSDNGINIKTLVKFNLFTDNYTFDNNLYTNIITNITLASNESNSKDTLKVTTLNSTSADDVVITDNLKEYSVETIYKKTKNTFDNVLQDVSDCSIKKLKVWESNDHSTHIKVWYNPIYDYTKKILSKGTSISTKKLSFSIRILLPEDVKYDKITTTDQYWNNKFIINIPGNYKKYYTSYKPIINNSSIKSVSVAQSDDKTQLIVKTKSLCGYKLTSDTGFFTVKVGTPQSIYSKIVLLDAGHGGKDAGACANGLKEKNLNLEIIYKRLEKYLNSPSSDIKAYWTRNDDTFINLYTRPQLSKKYGADLFISLHMNSASKSANGTEIYYSKQNNSTTSSGLSSKKAADIMIDTITNSLNSKNRGVKQAGFVVTKYNSVPSILIELGFITGSSDHINLKKTSYREKSAKAIYNGIKTIFEKYPTGR